tara:strand:- start:22 stop:135 length:114 start_codon:yes stop_codon:yes gene_type:complete
MRINLENVDFAVVAVTLAGALLVGGLIIYVWLTDKDR